MLLGLWGGARAQTPGDDCFTDDNYRYKESTHSFFVFTKHLNATNCIKLNTYKRKVFDFFVVDREDQYHRIEIEAVANQTYSKYNVTVRTENLKTNVALEDPDTHKTNIYMKTDLTQILIAVPFAYPTAIVRAKARHGHKEMVKIYLDTSPVDEHPYAMTLFDYIFFYVDLTNALILVDLGIIVLLVFRSARPAAIAHRKVMWVVLFVQLVSLLYFLFRYQIYFMQEELFFYYFLTSVTIDVFQILNTSLGVYLEAAILDKYVYQDTIFYKKLHRTIGVLAFVMIKINIFIKWLMFRYVIRARIETPMKLLALACPTLWLLYALFFLFKLITRPHALQEEKLKLERKTSALEKTLNYADLVAQMKTDCTWFIFENSVYVVQPSYIHPGGNFMIERAHKRHVTKYFYGASAMEAFPFKDLKFNHASVLFDQSVVKEKYRLTESPFFMKKDINQRLPPNWLETNNWYVDYCMKLNNHHLLMYLWTNDELIDRDLIKHAVSNLGKYFLLRFKNSNSFKVSFIQLSQDPFFADLKKIYCNKLLLRLKENCTKTEPDPPRAASIDVNFEGDRDFVYSELINKYVKKFDTLTVRAPAHEDEYIEELPVILYMNKKSNFYHHLEKGDAEALADSYESKSGPVRLRTRLRLTVGGPFGFENLLTEGQSVFFHVDDWGLSAFQDFAFRMTQHFLELLGELEPSLESTPIPKFNMNFVYYSKVPRLNGFNEFLLTFYLFEKLQRQGWLSLLFSFGDFLELEKFLKENDKKVEDADMHIISAKFKNANTFYSNIRKFANRNNIYFF